MVSSSSSSSSSSSHPEPNFRFTTKNLPNVHPETKIMGRVISNIMAVITLSRPVPRKFLCQNLLNAEFETRGNREVLEWKATREPRKVGTLSFHEGVKVGLTGSGKPITEMKKDVKKRIAHINALLQKSEEHKGKPPIVVMSIRVTNTSVTMRLTESINFTPLFAALPPKTWKYESQGNPWVIYRPLPRKYKYPFFKFYRGSRVTLHACTSEEQIEFMISKISPWILRCCNPPKISPIHVVTMHPEVQVTYSVDEHDKKRVRCLDMKLDEDDLPDLLPMNLPQLPDLF
ncbi:MAG: hypothetical protein ACTSUE_16000 [Promethearchaeota archaeon]